MKFDIVVPILGFDDLKEVSLEKIDDIFMLMKSTQNPHISFTLIDPFVLREYDFEVPQKIQELLEIDKTSNLITLNIVLIQTPIEESIVNFAAPMVFNTSNHKAAQIVLNETTEYGVAERISTFLKK
ncbi:MAG: flagellar assembly factor FliW [Campylobacterota bacterium]|nr:flagellar assembly factor FliW [Campylobacterota bacterium]